MENINTDTNKPNQPNLPKQAPDKKAPEGNPDVNFGADETDNRDVEVNTGGLGNSSEVDLDRSGVDTEGGQDDLDKSEGAGAGVQ